MAKIHPRVLPTEVIMFVKNSVPALMDSTTNTTLSNTSGTMHTPMMRPLMTWRRPHAKLQFRRLFSMMLSSLAMRLT